MDKNASTQKVGSQQEFEKLRSLILGENNHVITSTVTKDARKIVSNVFTEALHDRQQQDGSVNKTLLPLLENAIEQSVSQNGERLAGSLYPIMGSLVRKYIGAFLTDFMERTNQLIENSLTIKGLKWRIQAWQSGISFSQFVAAQTFVYKVEHVLLIHRETGLLLNSAHIDKQEYSNADLISSMLSAINDFVGDSFLANENGLKEQLQTVTTDNFTLLIKPGPSALIVAAVVGNAPQAVSDQLQLTLEEIHRLYLEQLNHFNGDNQAFSPTDNVLSECLLTEHKHSETTDKTTPKFAWLVLLSLMLFACYQTVQWWQQQQLIKQIKAIENQPGIIIKNIASVDDNNIALDILRDPDAISIASWFKQQQLPYQNIKLTEHYYNALDLPLLNVRAQRIMEKYPQVSADWQNNVLQLSGTLSAVKKQQLLSALLHAGFQLNTNLIHQQLKSESYQLTAADEEIKQQLLQQLINQISAVQLNFIPNSDTITEDMQQELVSLAQDIELLNQLTQELTINYALLVMGSSDNSGIKKTNERLSIKRAENAANELLHLGVDKEKIQIIGLGEINTKAVADNARKVLFNVLYTSKANATTNKPTEIEQE